MILVSINSAADSANNRRPDKGQSVMLATPDFVAIDLETTGLSPDYDDIIELAAIRYRNGKAVEGYEQLINPGYQIDEFITEMTGITDEMLSCAPELSDKLQEFVDFIGSDYVVGHNVSFDVNFIYDSYKNLKNASFSNDFIDTLRISRRLLTELPNHKLDTVVNYLQLPDRGLHRAGNDALLAGSCYLEMIKSPNFEDAIKPSAKSYSHGIAKTITANEGLQDEDSLLYGKVCAFTGTLESFSRKEAMQVVADIGGIPADGVTQKTNFLILGNYDYCKSIKEGKSAKLKKAEKLILSGADLQVIPESVFLDILSSSGRE